MSKPFTELDEKSFEHLCQLQCNLMEIASFFDCSHDTVERWCVRHYGKNFKQIWLEKHGKGLVSLRRSQFKMSEYNPTMAIWLGKQYLNQRDVQITANVETNEDDDFTKAIKESLKENK